MRQELGDLGNRPRIAKREGMMKFALGLLLSASVLMAQSNDSPDAHVAAAKTLAGQDYVNLFNTTCSPPQTVARGQAPARGQGGRGGGQRQGSPDRSTWHAEPVKV